MSDLPIEHPPRIDFSRCVQYATDKAEIAMAQFKAKYGVTPSLCVASNIGGNKRVETWIVGYVPDDWKP